MFSASLIGGKMNFIKITKILFFIWYIFSFTFLLTHAILIQDMIYFTLAFIGFLVVIPIYLEIIKL